MHGYYCKPHRSYRNKQRRALKLERQGIYDPRPQQIYDFLCYQRFAASRGITADFEG